MEQLEASFSPGGHLTIVIPSDGMAEMTFGKRLREVTIYGPLSGQAPNLDYFEPLFECLRAEAIKQQEAQRQEIEEAAP